MTSRSPTNPPTTLLVPGLQIVDVDARETPDWPIEYTWLEPHESAEWLEKAAEDETFRNRPVLSRDLNLMKQTMETGGFIHFLPDGPFIFDEFGILTNGKLRMTAAVQTGTLIGVIVFRGVPRRLFAYLGTGRTKTYKDIRFASAKMNSRDVLAVHKLCLKYEEIVHGVKPPTGWQDWNTAIFQPADLEHVGNLRADIEGYYANALAVRRGCKLTTTALMMFEFYQWHAWPGGRNQLDEFLESLAGGGVDRAVYPSTRNSPAISLRNFGRDEYCPTRGKAQIQLMLLINHFAAFVAENALSRVTWAYGLPLPLPYHPDGDAAARRNLSKLPPLNQARTE